MKMVTKNQNSMKRKPIKWHVLKFKWVNGWKDTSLQKYLNGTNTGDYYNGLSETAKGMIVTTKYYLGGSDSASGDAETY